MKKKIIFAIATSFFLMATVFNMSVLQSNNVGDVSLESIAVMAQASWEYRFPWQDMQDDIDEYNDSEGMEPTAGSACYGETTSYTYGGSHTTHSGSSNSVSVSVDFSGAGVESSVTNHSGESVTVEWSTSTHQILLGYETICALSPDEGSCTPISCDEIKMNY